MNPQERGEFNESRALQALKELRTAYPDFVLAVRRSSPEVDARGIDILVTIALLGSPDTRPSKKRMTVPIEIKSSSRGVAKWKVVHSDLHHAGVLIFYLPLKNSPRTIRRLMYRALDKIRHNSRNGTLYHGMFQRLFKGRGSRNLRKNVELIRQSRAKKD